MKRTGYLSCSNDSLNKLFSNIIWGQKGNFVDVPTDCQQRDERLGWAGGKHYGDWLGLDAPSGSYKGASDETFIASAFYAYSTSLVIKAGNVLDKDVSEFEDLYAHIIKTFRSSILFTIPRQNASLLLILSWQKTARPQLTSWQKCHSLR